MAQCRGHPQADSAPVSTLLIDPKEKLLNLAEQLFPSALTFNAHGETMFGSGPWKRLGLKA